MLISRTATLEVSPLPTVGNRGIMNVTDPRTVAAVCAVLAVILGGLAAVLAAAASAGVLVVAVTAVAVVLLFTAGLFLSGGVT